MAAWPPTPTTVDMPRRSSRSRSPRRRDSYSDTAGPDYAPYAGHGGDDDRRTSWGGGGADYYDRRRGRSRSPGPEEGSRKRRRSPSPYDRDRFDPRPRYGDDYDAHSRSYGHTSPRSRSGGSHYGGQPGLYPPHPPGMTRSGRVPMDPFLYQPHPASLRQYAEWFRAFYPKEAKEEDDLDRQAEKEAGKRVRDGIRARWEKYKKQHAAVQLQTLFDHHKKSPWFNEKYNPAPEWVNLRKRVRKQGWKGRTEQFLKDLEQGLYDPQNQKQESAEDKSSSVEEKPSEEAPPAEEMEPVDEETPENGPDTLVKDSGVSKQNGSLGRQSSKDDVMVVPEGNQIAIRTIPPDIGRQKIEEACGNIPGFIHLALGDPLQKRHYYRAGWMKFAEDTDMANAMAVISDKKIEGFKLHITHISRPYQARMRQAPEIASTPQRIRKDLEQARRVAELLEEEYVVLRAMKPGPEPSPERKDKTTKEGEDTVMASEIVGEDERAMVSENGGEEESLEPLEKGSEAIERRAEKLVAELSESLEGEELELKKSLIALDLYLAYLRAAYNACYYCVAVCAHSEELHRKCPKHVRKPLSEALKEKEIEKAVTGGDDAMDVKEDEEKPKEKEKGTDRMDRKSDKSDERWTEWIDTKISLLVNRLNIDPVEFGGKSYEEELRKAVEPHIKQEDEGKFRCRSCNKLFKAASFVEKHVANKHPDLIKSLEEIPFFNNFILDPHHVQPFAHLPPPMGSTSAPPQAYGLQPSPAYSVAPMASYYGYPPPPQAYGAANGYEFYMPGPHAWGGPPPPPRRDDSGRGGRLQDRMGGYAYASSTELTIAGLPAKPQTGHEPAPGEVGHHGGRGRRGRAATGPPPPPPPDAKEDPRAASGRKVSYHDMDDVAEGDVELTY